MPPLSIGRSMLSPWLDLVVYKVLLEQPIDTSKPRLLQVVGGTDRVWTLADGKAKTVSFVQQVDESLALHRGCIVRVEDWRISSIRLLLEQDVVDAASKDLLTHSGYVPDTIVLQVGRLQVLGGLDSPIVGSLQDINHTIDVRRALESVGHDLTVRLRQAQQPKATGEGDERPPVDDGSSAPIGDVAALFAQASQPGVQQMWQETRAKPIPIATHVPEDDEARKELFGAVLEAAKAQAKPAVQRPVMRPRHRKHLKPPPQAAAARAPQHMERLDDDDDDEEENDEGMGIGNMLVSQEDGDEILQQHPSPSKRPRVEFAAQPDMLLGEPVASSDDEDEGLQTQGPVFYEVRTQSRQRALRRSLSATSNPADRESTWDRWMRLWGSKRLPTSSPAAVGGGCKIRQYLDSSSKLPATQDETAML